MTHEERVLTILYLEGMKDNYIEGEGYERHPLPEYYAIEEAIKALKQAPKWIPVSERLPKKEDCPMDCLVTRKSENIGNYTDMAVAESDGTWTHEDWKAITFGDRVLGKKAGLISTRDDDIVAWMPLPQPYKEG
jgi:hypothetical protein